MLDVNTLRKEFAQQLLDDHARFSFDRALMYVLNKAYQQGLKDAQEPDDEPVTHLA
jgi:hypothetical protein